LVLGRNVWTRTVLSEDFEGKGGKRCNLLFWKGGCLDACIFGVLVDLPLNCMIKTGRMDGNGFEYWVIQYMTDLFFSSQLDLAILLVLPSFL
jgi:hypothetical protein